MSLVTTLLSLTVLAHKNRHKIHLSYGVCTGKGNMIRREKHCEKPGPSPQHGQSWCDTWHHSLIQILSDIEDTCIFQPQSFPVLKKRVLLANSGTHTWATCTDCYWWKEGILLQQRRKKIQNSNIYLGKTAREDYHHYVSILTQFSTKTPHPLNTTQNPPTFIMWHVTSFYLLFVTSFPRFSWFLPQNYQTSEHHYSHQSIILPNILHCCKEWLRNPGLGEYHPYTEFKVSETKIKTTSS